MVGFRIAVIAAAVLAFGAGVARAQDFPTRNITIIVPYPAGGPTDQAARTIAPRMAAKLGQNVVIENISGGGTTIATGRVARAEPDGYTLLLHNLQISINVALYPNTNYNTERDLTAVGFVNRSPLVLIGRQTLQANTLAELLAWMKTTPAKYAYPGPGSSGHVAGALFAQKANVKMDFIPYRGAAPAMTDLLGGHVDLFFGTPQSALEPVRAQKAKLYGIASKEDLPNMFPGAPNFVRDISPELDIQFWNNLTAPAATPKPVLEKLNRVLSEVLDDPDVVKSFEATGFAPYAKNERSLEFANRLMASEVARWGKVVKENNIQAPTN